MLLLINIGALILLSVACTLLSLVLREPCLDPREWPYRERAWEDGGAVYERFLFVRRWKDRLPELSDFVPAVFSKKRVRSFSPAQLRAHLVESCRAEAAHAMIIVSSLAFGLWNGVAATVLMVSLAAVVNAPFIVIQRATRPRILRLLARIESRQAAVRPREGVASRRVLVISAAETGHGHTSIMEALRAELAGVDDRAEVTVVDGFRLGPRWLRVAARMYDPLVVNVPFVWGWLYRAGDRSAEFVVGCMSRIIRRGLRQRLAETRPDVIVSLHGLFVGSVLDVLERERQSIPVITVIADLDNVTRLWGDSRAWCTVCPSEESMQRMRELGLDESRLMLSGLPVRPRFSAPAPPELPGVSERPGDTAAVLFVSGSQGSRRTLRLARAVLGQTECTVSILAGRDAAAVARLERGLAPHRKTGRAQVHGFTPAVDAHMRAADLLAVRASPNVLTEAVVLGKPFVVIGALRGQEARNPGYVQRHDLGVVCMSARRLPGTIRRLFADGGRRLREIHESQLRFRRPYAAREVSALILQAAPDALPVLSGPSQREPGVVVVD